ASGRFGLRGALVSQDPGRLDDRAGGGRGSLVFVFFALAQVFFYGFDQSFAAGKARRSVGGRAIGVGAAPMGSGVQLEAFFLFIVLFGLEHFLELLGTRGVLF